MMGTIAEKVPCEPTDHRQHGLIKQRHALTKVKGTVAFYWIAGVLRKLRPSKTKT